jgi:GT2 family glycosyltransferase
VAVNRGSDISVVVVNYNGRRWLPACLGALAAQEGVDAETILVDNGSSDGSVALVQAEFPQVRVVALGENVGFAAGNNIGARATRGRYLAFLNNDTEPARDWLAALTRGLEAHPWAAMAASRIVWLDDPERLDSAGDGVTRWGGAFKHAHGQPVTHALEPREVFGVCAAACLMRREVFEAVGGFDEDFFLVHEDVDFSYRAQLLGYRTVYVPDAVVRHAFSATLGRVSAESVFYGQRNLEWVYWKNTPWPLLARSLPGHVVYDAVAGLYFAGIGMVGPFVRGKWAALRGMPRVWRKRRQVQRARRSECRRIWRLMERRWLALKIREKRFDLSAARAQ